VLGPHTNTAKLLKAYPDVNRYINRIVFMGGGLKRANMTPYAEFNAWTDAESLKIVVEETTRLGIQLVMVPLDVTESILLEPKHIEYVKLLPHSWT
jgi:inosine-uridine nucleoside N-ribohydrolase